MLYEVITPIGVAAAIYLEEFAPNNGWTDLIEININNLAAVPSIIFGLVITSYSIHYTKLYDWDCRSTICRNRIASSRSSRAPSSSVST